MGHGRNAQPGPFTVAIAAILYSGFLELLVTQDAFARSLDIPASTMSEYLHGIRVIDLETFVRLSKAVGLEPPQVIEIALSLLEG